MGKVQEGPSAEDLGTQEDTSTQVPVEKPVEDEPLTEENVATLEKVAADDEAATEEIADILGITPEEKKKLPEDETPPVEEEAEEVVEEEVVVEEEITEDETTESGEEEPEDKLLVELAKIMAVINPPKDKSVEGEEKLEEEVVAEEVDYSSEVPDVVNYFTSEQAKELFDDEQVALLNTIINQVRKDTISHTRNATLKDGMRVFPQMMDYKTQGYIAAQEFWAANPDIKKITEEKEQVKQYVNFKATEIQRAHPDWTLGQVYRETEKEVREILGERLNKYQPSDDPDKKVRKPSFAKEPGGARKVVTPKTTTTQQSEIKELMDFDM